MVLESSVEEFVARFAPYAAEGTLYPQHEGSPLLEFAAAGRVLYLFDRTGPYAVKPGNGRVIVHGVTEAMHTLNLGSEAAGVPTQQLNLLGVSAVEGVGMVEEVFRGLTVVRARLPLVLGSLSGLPTLRAGDWVSFRTTPPLHGFVV
nr:hypothetical protein [Deinococcus peraridilitoris]